MVVLILVGKMEMPASVHVKIVCFPTNLLYFFLPSLKKRSKVKQPTNQFNAVLSNGPLTIFPCPANANGEWKWWCGDYTGGKTCTQGSKSTFFFWKRAGIKKVVTDDQSSFPADTPDPTPPTSSTDTPSSSSHTDGVAAGNSSNNGDNNSVNATSVSSTSGMVKKSVPLGIGLGAAVPFLAAALAFGGLYLRERKNRLHAEQFARFRNNGGELVTYGGSVGAGAGAGAGNVYQYDDFKFRPMEPPSSAVSHDYMGRKNVSVREADSRQRPSELAATETL